MAAVGLEGSSCCVQSQTGDTFADVAYMAIARGTVGRYRRANDKLEITVRIWPACSVARPRDFMQDLGILT